ncbi:MAG: InlB B-repeat-containing protein, partial [Acholeplasmataceae bacterium]|nr:InlB B-repeat-containing protein [Acholeplasmataceae bacterium]
TGNLIKNSSALIFHYSENENETVSYQYPEETSAPTEPEKTGYRFLGWYLESELETAFIFGNPLLKDYDLYPKWVKEYQISFVENGGTKVNTLILTEEDDREFTNFRKRG